MEAVKRIAECYHQEGDVSITPFYSLPGEKDMLPDQEVKAKTTTEKLNQQ